MNRMNDVPSEDSEWELSKENVQPIKQGRKMPNLMAALGSNVGEDAHWKLQRDKKNFEAEIRTYDGEDPLDVWYRYFLWTEENVPKGGREISTLLERCIKDFKDVPKYRSDERYLNIWLRYADCCSDPLEIFNYMYSQKICPTHSQFYISWASACENVENFKKADEIIELGIARKAKPEELLKKYHIGFQHRLTMHIANKDDSHIQEDQDNSRTTLGVLKADKKRNVGVARASNVLGGASGFKKSSGIKNLGLSLSVYHDPDCENKVSRLPGALGDWKDPPTQSSIAKENELQPGKWTNDKPSSRRGNSAVPLARPVVKPSFQVHVEENASQARHVPRQTLGSQVLAVRKPEQDDSHDPLKVISQDQSDGNEQPKSKVMYDKGKVYTGTEEFQFEEIRAAKYAVLRKQGLPLPKDTRKRERSEETSNEKRERVMYPKEQVYALEGEFQLEEIMARRYRAQGKRLRPDRKPGPVNPAGVNVYAEPMDTSKPMPFGEKVFASIDSQRNRPTVASDALVTKLDKENRWGNNKENGNLVPGSILDTGRLALKGMPRSSRSDVEMGITTSDRLPQDDDRYPLKPKQLMYSLINEGNENVVLPSTTNVQRGALRDVSRASTSDRPSDEIPANNSNQQTKHSERFVKETEQENCALNNKRKENCIPASSTGRKAVNQMSTPGKPRAGEQNNDGGYAKVFDLLYKDLAAPSPTLTTKQAYAAVMPWFNTTVGANDSDAEFEAQFKNDSGNAENDDDLFGIPFGGASSFGKQHNEPEVYPFHDQNDENIPPTGYTQPKNDRPIVGILQPSLNIPVEPLEDVVYKDQEVAVKYEKLKDHGNEEEFTQFQGLNHSQFTQAARLASTPFGEQTDPRSLPTFHCSTIRATDADIMKQQTPMEHSASHVEQPSATGMGTPNAALSPILECSDEDRKTSSGSSGSSSSHYTTTGSSVSHCAAKVSVGSHQSQMVVPVCGSDDGGGGNGISMVNLETSQLERTLDITVHHANGDVFQMVNPFDPVVCQTFLSKLNVPVSSYPRYHDLSHKVMAKVVPDKTIDLGGNVYNVEKKIGTGAFGKVFSANAGNSKEKVALKIQSPANVWEFYVCNELQKRLQSKTRQDKIAAAVEIDDFYVFLDGSCCVSTYHEKGTFLDLVNYYKRNSRLAEHTACYYGIELMKILDCIHECGVIHGDIKPDNLVLTTKPDSHPGLALIDFGCAIDCTLFPAGTRFSVQKNTESFECIEMKTGRPWTTQVDTYGMLGTLHCLMFGEYMKVYKDPKSLRWRPIKIVNRTWNKELWKKLFDVFLNIPSCDELPSLKNILVEFQQYFDAKLKERFVLHIEQQNSTFC